MPADKNTVNKLVAGAWSGIECVITLERESGIEVDPSEVVSAALTLADRAIAFACAAGGSPEENERNKVACRAALQQIMMKTSDNLKVF